MEIPVGFFRGKGSEKGSICIYNPLLLLYTEGGGKYMVRTIEESGKLREYQTDLKYFSQDMEPIEPEEVKKIIEEYRQLRTALIKKVEFLERGLEELAKSNNNEKK
ncbi:hypothetical protein A3K73_00165 [Candidatus Pacearchaeota archaeon RBG_13_36_9]|nr:MAG: hypothetical protein A3K73_00165 [Candidatus Pacearchaeota archaeon RBG_13_36_9]